MTSTPSHSPAPSGAPASAMPSSLATLSVLILGAPFGPSQSVGDALARAGATSLFADTVASLRSAFARSPARAILMDGQTLTADTIAAVATAWPHARRICIGGWPPPSAEKLAFHLETFDSSPGLARAVGVIARLTAPSPTGPSPSVLVIDDMRTMRQLAACMLEQAGYVVTAVPTMEEALAHLERVQYDAVLTDVFMAGMGGIEGIQELRRRAPGVAIAAMSGGLGERMGKGSALVAALKIGAHRAVSKPFQPGDLVAAVQGAIDDVRGGVAPVAAAQ